MTAAAIAVAWNRFGLGARPSDTAADEPKRWLLDQFSRYQPMPAAWAGLPRTAEQLSKLEAMQRAAREAPDGQRAAARQAYRRELREDYLASVAARANAALQAGAPFVERLVHFWSNHFAVSVDKIAVVGLAGPFEAEAIRPHVLGRFEDMLVAVAQHPAMLLYLDQAQSIGPASRAAQIAAERNPQRRRGLNENLAREILELHTLGVRSGYTQADVVEFARALTGWSVAGGFGAARRLARDDNGVEGDTFRFRTALHEPGDRSLLGKTYAGSGEAQARAILADLARSPATARHIATKLACHFCADDPPEALVQRLSDAYLRSDGDLPSLYRVLVESPECWDTAANVKFRTPWEWGIASLRAMGREEIPAIRMAGLMQQIGQPVWRPGSPAGYDDVAASWAAPDALLRRVEAAQRMASQAPSDLDPRALAAKVLPGAVGEHTATAIARAESPATGLALLLVSPEFLRR
jgi:uncharacterized protein (DUF1800 family)